MFYLSLVMYNSFNTAYGRRHFFAKCKSSKKYLNIPFKFGGNFIQVKNEYSSRHTAIKLYFVKSCKIFLGLTLRKLEFEM